MKLTTGYRRKPEGTRPGSGRASDNRPRETREERIFFALGVAAIALSLAVPLGGGNERADQVSRADPPAAVAVMSVIPAASASPSGGAETVRNRDRSDPGSLSSAPRSVYDEIGLFFARLFSGFGESA